MPRSSSTSTSGRSQTDEAYLSSECASTIALASGSVAATRMTSARRRSVFPGLLSMNQVKAYAGAEGWLRPMPGQPLGHPTVALGRARNGLNETVPLAHDQHRLACAGHGRVDELACEQGHFAIC